MHPLGRLEEIVLLAIPSLIAGNAVVIKPSEVVPLSSGEAAKALDALGLRRMVVGHTPQITAGINACCGGRVYRIDTGLSSFYGGMKQCLEVERGARPRVISSTPEYFW